MESSGSNLEIKSEPVENEFGAEAHENFGYGENWLSYEIKEEPKNVACSSKHLVQYQFEDNQNGQETGKTDYKVSEDVKEQNLDRCLQFSTEGTIPMNNSCNNGLGFYDGIVTREDDLDTCLTNQTKEKPYKGDICHKLYVQSPVFKKHLKTCVKERQCDISSESFSQSVDEKPYKCDNCQRSFTQKCGLMKHVKWHKKKRPYQCNVCQKLFVWCSDLRRHSQSHTKDKPHKCGHCEKCFIHKGHLNEHSRVHTKERRHRCNMCQSSFFRSSDLKNHLMSHSKEKPYQCAICDKLFVRKTTLNRHVRIHTNEKPHKCDVCATTFSRKYQLTNHVRCHEC